MFLLAVFKLGLFPFFSFSICAFLWQALSNIVYKPWFFFFPCLEACIVSLYLSLQFLNFALHKLVCCLLLFFVFQQLSISSHWFFQHYLQPFIFLLFHLKLALHHLVYSFHIMNLHCKCYCISSCCSFSYNICLFLWCASSIMSWILISISVLLASLVFSSASISWSLHCCWCISCCSSFSFITHFLQAFIFVLHVLELWLHFTILLVHLSFFHMPFFNPVLQVEFFPHYIYQMLFWVLQIHSTQERWGEPFFMFFFLVSQCYNSSKNLNVFEFFLVDTEWLMAVNIKAANKQTLGLKMELYSAYL